MTTTEIKQLFSEIQKKLETLQNERASFLFLSDEGNHFCMGGDTTRIMAQITFNTRPSAWSSIPGRGMVQLSCHAP